MKNYWIAKILIAPLAMILTFITLSMFAGMIALIFGINFYDITNSGPFAVFSIVTSVILFIFYCMTLDEHFEQLEK